LAGTASPKRHPERCAKDLGLHGDRIWQVRHRRNVILSAARRISNCEAIGLGEHRHRRKVTLSASYAWPVAVPVPQSLDREDKFATTTIDDIVKINNVISRLRHPFS